MKQSKVVGNTVGRGTEYGGRSIFSAMIVYTITANLSLASSGIRWNNI